jgi:zinc protease
MRCYRNHPNRMPVIGGATREGYTTQDALAFYDQFYGPNAVLVVGGDVTVEEVRKLAKYFGPIPKQSDITRQRLQSRRRARRAGGADRSARAPALSHPRSYLAPNFRNAKGNEGYALTVLGILTGGTAGRLYHRMVIEQQSVLGIDTGYDGGAFDLGRFNFYATPRQGGDLAAAEKAMDEQIGALLKDGVTDQEVADAKRRLQIAAVKARDSVSGPVFIVAEALGKGRALADVQAWPERIESVTAADVLAVAAQIFKPANSVTGTLLPKPAQEAGQP